MNDRRFCTTGAAPDPPGKWRIVRNLIFRPGDTWERVARPGLSQLGKYFPKEVFSVVCPIKNVRACLPAIHRTIACPSTGRFDKLKVPSLSRDSGP